MDDLLLNRVSEPDFPTLMNQKWNSGIVRLYKPQTVIPIASADA